MEIGSSNGRYAKMELLLFLPGFQSPRPKGQMEGPVQYVCGHIHCYRFMAHHYLDICRWVYTGLSGLYWFVLVYTSLYWFGLVYTDLYWFVLAYTDLYWLVVPHVEGNRISGPVFTNQCLHHCFCLFYSLLCVPGFESIAIMGDKIKAVAKSLPVVMLISMDLCLCHCLCLLGVDDKL